MTILDFSVYVFDLDGVIINSENIHYECYKLAFKKQINYDLGWDEYCEIHHSILNSFEKQFSESYEEIYDNKTQLYRDRIKDIELVSGFYEFFTLLIKNGKYIFYLKYLFILIIYIININKKYIYYT